jgi:hypothetical protein
MPSNDRINAEIARQREIEVSRQALRWGAIASELDASLRPPPAAVTIRIAGADDHEDIALLAWREDASIPRLPRLIAELGGRTVAALSLADGEVVADSSGAHADVIALMRVRASQIGGIPRRRRRLRDAILASLPSHPSRPAA